jgi:hypothetical protein
MGRLLVHRGKVTQRETPEWAPLLEVVGEQLTGAFMWMLEVELADGRLLQAYKHIDTRRYVHLDPAGAAFVYESPRGYRHAPVADVLAAVFAPLPGLAGVSSEQIAASWAAVARLDDAAGSTPADV